MTKHYVLRSTDQLRDRRIGPRRYGPFKWYARYACWVYNFCESRWGDPNTRFRWEIE